MRENRNINYDNPVDEEDIESMGYSVSNPNEGQKVVSEKDDPNGYEKPQASEIPQDEQTVMIDNAKVSGVDEGEVLKLVIDGSKASVFYDDKKVGDLKPLFVERLCESRKGQYAYCTLHSKSVPIMIKLKYYKSKGNNKVKI